MEKLVCSAHIENKEERKAIMAWVRASNPESYSEIGTEVSVTWSLDVNDPEYSASKWGKIHVFENYKRHSIQSPDY